MILAAGLGLRMRPLTSHRPKPCLPVLNRPLLAWTLEALARQGVLDVVVNTHYLPAQVRESLAIAASLGIRVSLSHERRLLGTGGGPRRARRLLGTAPVLLINGDVYFDFDLGSLLDRHRRSGAAATLALKPNPDPDVYGPIVTSRSGRILSLAGRPRPAEGLLSLFTGVHVMDPSLLERLPPGPSDSVRDLYAPLVAEGHRLLGVRVRGAWHDLGTPALYLRAQEALLRRFPGAAIHPTARVDATARVLRSVVGDGCVVGPRGRVVGSALFSDVQIARGARVVGSILSDGIRVGAGERVTGKVGVRHSRGTKWVRLQRG